MNEGFDEHLGSVSIADRVDLVCDAFERRWILGGRPKLEDFLAAIGIKDQLVLFRELLAIEIEYRRKAREQIEADEYTLRFPAWSAELKAVFSSMPTAPANSGERTISPAADSPTRVPDASFDVARPRRAARGAASLPSTLTLADLSGLPSLGKFRLERVVGSGAFGEVFRAYDTELDRYVAVKLPRAETAESGEAALLFHEAKNVSRLKHPGIVPVFDVGRTDSTCYIISEFVDGPTLARELGRRRFSPAESCELVAELADALDYAHGEGVVHRDLKPSNILLEIRAPGSSFGSRKSGENRGPRIIPRIVDFGLGKRTLSGASISGQGEVLGTPGYMSPEQAVGETHAVDGRSDIYSLGVIFYQMLTGDVPFRGDLSSLIDRVVHEPPRRPRAVDRSIPRDLEVICLKCLAKSPHDRYQHAADLAADLRRWLGGMPIHARPVSWVGRSWRWCRRYPGLAATIALALMLAVGGGAAVLVQRLSNLAFAERSAKDTVNNLLNVDSGNLAATLAEIRPRLGETEPELRRALAVDLLSAQGRMRLQVAILPALDKLAADNQAQTLFREMLSTADAHEFLVMREALLPHARRLLPELEDRLARPGADPHQTMRLLLLLSEWGPGTRDTAADAVLVAEGISRASDIELATWLQAAGRLKTMLPAPFERLFAAESETTQVRTNACRALAILHAGDPEKLVRLLLAASAAQHRVLVEALRKHPGAVQLLRPQIAPVPLPADANDDANGDALVRQQVNVLCALLQLGGSDSDWQQLAHRPDPRVQTYFIHTAQANGIPPAALARQLRIATDAGVLYALILALGTYPPEALEGLPAVERKTLNDTIKNYFEFHHDSGVHSAAGWLMRTWGKGEELTPILARLMTEDSIPEGRHWYINPVGQTMVIVRGEDEGGKCGPITEAEAGDISPDAWKKVRWTFAIAATETNWAEYLRNDGAGVKPDFEINLDGEAESPRRSRQEAVAKVSVPDVLDYCIWLSGQEKIGQSVRQTASGFEVDLNNEGYRLPLDVEWQRACRAMTMTSCFYGERQRELAKRFVQDRFGEGHPGKVASQMPNRLGLFDTLGNVAEYTLEEVDIDSNPIGVREVVRQIVVPNEMTGQSATGDPTRIGLVGGSFGNKEEECRPDMRNRHLAHQWATRHTFGFRVVRTLLLE